MALKTFKPTSAGLRHVVIVDRSELHKGKPVKELTEGLKKSGGRNNYGRLTAFRKGGGHKRRYRLIDFKRRKFDMAATVERLEYDPNRTAFIALIKYQDGELSLHPGAAALEGGRRGRLRRARRREAGQRDAAEEHPGRHHRAQRRAEARQGRPDGPRRRHLRAARRPRPGQRAAAHVLRRSAHGAGRVHGDDRRRQQPGQPEHRPRQGRSRALAGHPPDRPAASP